MFDACVLESSALLGVSKSHDSGECACSRDDRWRNQYHGNVCEILYLLLRAFRFRLVKERIPVPDPCTMILADLIVR